MDDDRLIRQLRLIDTPATPSAEFVESLHDELAAALGLGDASARREPAGRRRTSPNVTRWLVAALLLIGLAVSLLVAGALVDRRPAVPEILDVVTFMGDGTRRGLQPGPGPIAPPVVAWEQATGYEIYFSPVIADGTVVFGSFGGRVHAFDARTGEPRWRFDAVASVNGSAAATTDAVFVRDGTGALIAIDLATGVERWRTADLGTDPAHPIVVGDLVFIGAADGHVYGFDLSTGDQAWAWLAPAAVRDLTVVHGVVYAAAADGSLAAARVSDRQSMWTMRASGTIEAILVDGPRLYLVVADGDRGVIRSIDRQTGASMGSWAHPAGLGLTAVAAHGGVLFVSAEGAGTYALDGSDLSRVAWHAPAVPDISGGISISDGTLYGTSPEGWLLALRATDGHERWRERIEPGTVNGVPAVSGGAVFVGDTMGTVRALVEPALVALLPSAVVRPSERPGPANPFEALDRFDPKVTGLGPVSSLDVGPDGNLYVLEMSSRVTVLSPRGEVITGWGRRGSGPEDIDLGPDADVSGRIAVAPSGRVFVADRANGRIQVYEADGTHVRSIGARGDGKGRFLELIKIAVDDDGNVYATDEGRLPDVWLSKFGPDGDHIWTITKADVKNLHYACCGLEVVGDRIFLGGGNDTLSAGAVVVLDLDGRRVGLIAEDRPRCTFGSDSRGAIYLMACHGDQTEAFDPQGTLFGATHRGQRAFIELTELAVGPDGIGYGVAELDASIQVFRAREP